MKPIVTLTLNPTIDSASEAERVRPTHKTRTWNERYYPGGGGINVARVIAALGGAAFPVYLAGGPTGALLADLLRAEDFVSAVVPVAGNTRISHAVFERSTGFEYRFVAEGPEVTRAEWLRCLTAVHGLDFDWLVASGSLPRGMPVEAYAELAEIAAARGAHFVLDTSGPALAAAVAAGGIHLLKPSVGELAGLVGRPLETLAEQEAAAREVVAGGVGIVALTMGHHGALLADAGGTLLLRPPAVEAKSTTGAGDSFLAAMVHALAGGRPVADAFRRGVAAGTAAVLTPGTELCDPADVSRLEAALLAEA
jgi:6-phosphofructokinase 2